MTEEERQRRDESVAATIKMGRCPFGELGRDMTMAHCPSGFPGCGCADEWMLNPYLKDLWEEKVHWAK